MTTVNIRFAANVKGKTYEDRYGRWLDLFHEIAALDASLHVVVEEPPASWCGLLFYLGCEVRHPIEFFPTDGLAFQGVGYLRMKADKRELLRTEIEASCTLRPETIDALYKLDNEWKDVAPGRVIPTPSEEEFVVTTTAAFFRPEALHYLRRTLPAFEPKLRKVVLVPCAADKPYPAPLHKAIRAHVPADWYLACVTGTLGIVPEQLWDVMPRYDAGIPNEQRVEEVVRTYFSVHEHEAIVVYSDFNARAIDRALRDSNTPQWFVFGRDHDHYLDLMAPDRLARLWSTIEHAEASTTSVAA